MSGSRVLRLDCDESWDRTMKTPRPVLSPGVNVLARAGRRLISRLGTTEVTWSFAIFTCTCRSRAMTGLSGVTFEK